MRDETRYERVEERNGSKFLRLKSGRMVTFHIAQQETTVRHYGGMVRWLSRMVKLASDRHEYDWQDIERFIDQVDALVDRYRAELARRKVRLTKRERIQALRNVKGRTADEAAAFIAKADQLERELNEEMGRNLDI